MADLSSFPHPVLGWRDDIAGEFKASLRAEVVGDCIRFSCTDVLVENASLEGLMSAGSVWCLIRVRCPSTYFRRSWYVGMPDYSCTIESNLLREAADCDLRLVARRTVGSYRPRGLHADYGDDEFQIEPGDVLAIGPRFRIQIDGGAELIDRPVGSLFRVRSGEFDRGPYKLRLDGERIVVELSRLDWSHYSRLRDVGRPELHAALVLPVLSHALRELSDEDAPETLWRSRLGFIVDRRGLRRRLENREFVEAAQEILEKPFERMAQHFLNRLEVLQVDQE